MFNFKKSLIFSIALIGAGLIFFIFSTNSIEAKMEREAEKLAPKGGSAWDLPAGNYDDRVDSNEEVVITKPEPEPEPEPGPVYGDHEVTPDEVPPSNDDWETGFNRP